MDATQGPVGRPSDGRPHERMPACMSPRRPTTGCGPCSNWRSPTARIRHDWSRARRSRSAQSIPVKFLEGILRQLRQAGLIASHRGSEGGYRLDRPPSQITIADVVRALDGPLAAVRGHRPEDLDYHGTSEHLRDVWVAVRVSMRNVLEHITLDDVAQGTLPPIVDALLQDPDAWHRRPPGH